MNVRRATLPDASIAPVADAAGDPPVMSRPRSVSSSASAQARRDEKAGLKIVDITEFYSERGGGIRSHLTNRGRFLSEHHCRHCVIAPGPRDDEALICSEANSGGRSRLIRYSGPTLPYDRTYHLLHRVDRIRQRVRSERPDVLEAHSPYLATAAVAACGRGSARLHTAFWHSDHVGVYIEPALTKHFGEDAARAAAKLLWRGVRALLAPFDATFAAGRAQAEQLRAAGVPRVIHAPFGVDTRTFRPAARANDWRRKWLGDEHEGATLLVGVGRFAMEKRWDVVLEAFARVRTRRKAVLVLFGDGPERVALESSASSGVRFAGFETDRGRLATALASADVLVHGAPYETFGIGIAEAVACGLPIVVPDAGGAAEHAESSCSETYRSLDPVACAAAIESILNRGPDRRIRALDAAARVRTVEQHFHQVLGAYGELLRELER